MHNWVQIISPCIQELARCHVTRQRCSIAPAPKLSGTEKFNLWPEADNIILPRLAKSWQADVFRGPKVFIIFLLIVIGNH